MRRFASLRPEFIVRDVAVAGPPWNMRVFMCFRDRIVAPNGYVYENEGMEHIEIKCGLIREIRVHVDTEKVAALDAQLGAGDPTQAAAAPAVLGLLATAPRPPLGLLGPEHRDVALCLREVEVPLPPAELVRPTYMSLAAHGASGAVSDDRLRQSGANALLESIDGRCGLTDQLSAVESDELAVALARLAIDEHGVDIGGLRAQHHLAVGDVERGHVEIGRAEQDEVGERAFAQSTGHCAQSEVGGAGGGGLV